MTDGGSGGTAGRRETAPILVLVAPQDIVNIASAVRIAKNFGIDRLRLVAPEVFDPYRIEGIAHNTADLVERIEIVDTLDQALADCVWSLALSARERTAKRQSFRRPEEAAAEVVRRAAEGPVALVFGREDKGLSNEETDRCQALVAIPTSPAYRSLNLAQAIAIMSYECWRARGGEAAIVPKPPRREAGPATGEQLEFVFGDWERALWAIDFFKTRRAGAVMRSFRELIYRAGLDGREATLLRAMGIEVVRYLERVGAPIHARGPSESDAPAAEPGAGTAAPESE
ncbi:MAG TPA: TrmJ/YjtD family RNA methyltransferase [Gemmatimonadales bacterium]|nr:TrmJ/YjtD family RNA methyltransferase [Gemmatimonadales bacterium]